MSEPYDLIDPPYEAELPGYEVVLPESPGPGVMDPNAVQQVPPAEWSGSTPTCCHHDLTELPGSDTWAPNGSIVLIMDGTEINVGPPTLDLDGDGSPDSTIVAGADGNQYLVADLTGDAMADGLAIADGNGNLIGGFSMDNGVPVPVDLPAGMTLADLVGAPVESEAGLPPSSESVPEPVDGAVSPIGAAGSRVVLDTGTELTDLGPPTVDLDGDGILDAVVVLDDQGRPQMVVSELSTTGESDRLLLLDPSTGQIVNEWLMVDGVRQNAPVDAPTASGPETIVAPGAEYATTPLAMLTRNALQGSYNIASEVWFELADGQPYPRHPDGTPFDPGQVFIELMGTPGRSAEGIAQLQELHDGWLAFVGSAI